MENLADHQVPHVLRPAGFGGNICVFTSASDHQALPLVPGCLAWIQIKRSHAIKIIQLTGNRKNKFSSSEIYQQPRLGGDLSLKKSSEGAITDPRIMNLIWEFSNQSKCIKKGGNSRGFSQINVKLSVIFIALLTKTLIGIDL